MEGDNEHDGSLDSCNIVLADIQLEERDSRPEKGETMRNSRL